MPKATAAFSGAMFLVLFHIISQEEGLKYIDFNTIGLLMGMMIIVAIVRQTGLFQYTAIKAAKWAGGDPWKILVGFGLITAVSSAFLDNVTTVLLLTPVTMVICDTMVINPIPF